MGMIANLSRRSIKFYNPCAQYHCVRGHHINRPDSDSVAVALCRGHGESTYLRTNCCGQTGALHNNLVRRRLIRQTRARFTLFSSLRGGGPVVLPDDPLPPLPVRLCRAPQNEPPAPGSRTI